MIKVYKLSSIITRWIHFRICWGKNFQVLPYKIPSWSAFANHIPSISFFAGFFFLCSVFRRWRNGNWNRFFMLFLSFSTDGRRGTGRRHEDTEGQSDEDRSDAWHEGLMLLIRCSTWISGFICLLLVLYLMTCILLSLLFHCSTSISAGRVVGCGTILVNKNGKKVAKNVIVIPKNNNPDKRLIGRILRSWIYDNVMFSFSVCVVSFVFN